MNIKDILAERVLMLKGVTHGADWIAGGYTEGFVIRLLFVQKYSKN